MRIITRKPAESNAQRSVSFDASAQSTVMNGAGPWSYTGIAGPEYWSDLDPRFATCRDGGCQSPIALFSTAEREPGALTFDYRSIAPIRIVNDRTTIIVPGVPSSAMELDGERLELQQIHFHHPAEHRIDGVLLNLEIHFVHRATDGNFVVLAVLVAEGMEHEVIAPIVANLPTAAVKEVIIGGAFFPEDLLPPERAYFRYPGSRTMPPCEEGVEWLVLTDHIEMSPAQIEAVTAVCPFNARPLQPRNDRTVRCFEPSAMRSTEV